MQNVEVALDRALRRQWGAGRHVPRDLERLAGDGEARGLEQVARHPVTGRLPVPKALRGRGPVLVHVAADAHHHPDVTPAGGDGRGGGAEAALK